jgi:uncharacterized protein YgiM (DUF1202 family)
MRPLTRIFLCGAALLFFMATMASADQMSVTVRETQLRANPAFLGQVLSVLAYGDPVEVLQEQGPWFRVETGSNQRGWVHSSALTTKRIVLESAARDGSTGASGTEVALAGRGFNQEVENRYKSEEGLDFSGVDRMEGYEFPPEVLLAFLEEGGLEIPEGGAE